MATKQEKLIQKIKSNVLCTFVCKDPNYDYVNYVVEPIELKRGATSVDSLERIVTPKLQATKSRSRLPIYYKTPKAKDSTFNMKSIMKPSTNDYDEEVAVQHSTKIDENIKSPNISKFPFLVMSPQNNQTRDNQASSTMIYRILSNTRTIKNHQESPNVSEINEFNTLLSESSTESSVTEYETCEMSSTETSTSSENETILYEISSIYSCYISYKAQFDGDLSINFAERLQIIKDDGQDFVLVKNLSNKMFGYVPRHHIVPVNVFLQNLI